MRAPFIVFEGADGAGTTTQATRLVDRLRGMGIAAQETAEPTSGPFGRVLREYLQGGEHLSWRGLAHAFAADRCWHVEHVIRPLLRQGIVVVCDRFYHSTVVYQGLSEEGNRERMRDLAREVMAGVPCGYAPPEVPWWVDPDVTFILDGPAEVFWQRVLARGGAPDRFEKQEFHKKVVAAYHRFGWDVALASEPVKLIDGTLSADAVEEAVWADLERGITPAAWARCARHQQVVL
jgi:dTMP kinase